MLCLACEYRRSEGSAGLTGYILWPAAVPWTGGSLSVSCSRATRKFGRCAVVKSVAAALDRPRGNININMQRFQFLRWCRRSLLPRGYSKQTTVQFLAVILTCTRPTRPASANEAEPLSSCRFGGMPST